VPPRPLDTQRRAVLVALLDRADFDGRDELLAQVDAAPVVGRCTCGCATVDLAEAADLLDAYLDSAAG
jgi:hypothetical protein